MSHESLIGFFALASIVIAGGLGIASTITETKDKKGKLTKWGMVALAGIIISNSFSFLRTYFQSEKEKQESLVNAEVEKQRTAETNLRYQQQIDRLTAIVKKSDSSLKQQMNIQKETSTILNDLRQSVGVQNKIFKQSEVLTSQQNVVAENIGRTLNPLLPFKINLGLTIEADSNSVWLIVLAKLLQDKIDEIINKVGPAANFNNMDNSEFDYFKKQGIFPIPTDTKSYLLNNDYPYYKDLMKLFTNLNISMSFSKINNHSSKQINCEVLKEHLQNRNMLEKLQLFYTTKTNSFYFTLEDLPVHVSSDLPIGSYSLKDLEKSEFHFLVGDSPGPVRQANITFKFPPDFSRINYIKNKVRGDNVLTNYKYYNYKFKTVTHFVY